MLQQTTKDGTPNLLIPALQPTCGVTLNEIRLAAARIREAIPPSPCTVSRALSDLVGGTVFLKLENLQRTGSYKERGALNRLLTLTAAERGRFVRGDFRAQQIRNCNGCDQQDWDHGDSGVAQH